MIPEPLSHTDALLALSQCEPRTATSMPNFISAPAPIDMCERQPDDPMIRVAFACHDDANDRTYVVPVDYGEVAPQTSAQARARMGEMSVAALDVADRIAKAVFN